MGVIDLVREYLKEMKERGVVEIPYRKVVEEIARIKKCRITTVYNAIRELAMLGEIKVKGNTKEKFIVLEGE